ncbi:hypothetical protein B0A55_13328, partial [Friedmanniomyces simplex]
MDDIPVELRGLVTYLDSDDRPSAIVSGAGVVAYRNASFKGLPLLEHEAQLILDRLRRADEGDKQVQKIVADDGRTWKRAHLLNGWTTLVCVGGYEDQTQDAGIGLEPDLPSETKPEIPETNGSPMLAKSEYFDWTRLAAAGLPPWTQYIRDFDWASTPVGPMQTWSLHLRSVVVYMMNNPQPRLVVWDIYEGLRPYFEQAWRGNPVTLKELPVMMQREGSAVEEKHFDFSLLPIVGQDGHPIGILDELVDTTQAVRGRRRRDSVRNVGQMISSATTLKQLWPAFLTGLEPAVVDAPYAVLYSIQDDVPETQAEATQKKCVLEGTVGIGADHATLPPEFSLGMHLNTGPGLIKACLQAWQTGEPITLHSTDGSLPPSLTSANPGRAFDEEIRTAIVAPITTAVADEEMLGILVMGLSPRSPYDEEYKLWTHIVSDLVRKTATLIVLPEEQRRAQKIANELNDSLAQQLRVTTLQAERSEGKFRRMAESAPQGMYMFDAEGKTLHVNDRYLAMLGETREQHATRRPDGDDWRDQVHPEDLDRFIQSWDIIMQKKTPITIEYRLKKPWKSVDDTTGQDLEGETWLLANAFPDIGADGEVIAVMGWLTDVSHRRMAEKLLAQRLNDALENKRQTEAFIDMTSHEMRNPLSAILQSADSIVSTLTATVMPIVGGNVSVSSETADEIVDAAQTIILCAQHQKRIVDDILTLSKLDASLLVISPEK